MKWNELSAGVLNAAETRIRSAIGDHADLFAHRILTDPEALQEVIKIAAQVRWKKENDIFYLKVKSDGRLPTAFIGKLNINGEAYNMIRTRGFSAAHAEHEHCIAILAGKIFGKKVDINHSEVLQRGQTLGFKELHEEAMLYVAEKFLCRELLAMGFRWIIGMHKNFHPEWRYRSLTLVPDTFADTPNEEKIWIRTEWPHDADSRRSVTNEEIGFAFSCDPRLV